MIIVAQLREFKRILNDKQIKEKMMEEGEKKPFLPNFSQFEGKLGVTDLVEKDTHSLSITGQLENMRHAKSFNEESKS